MPGMDGLELARRLKEKNPDVAVILLTAYKDFEYAQKGIQYGVSNYLVKHELCEETLFAELDRIRERLERRREKGKDLPEIFYEPADLRPRRSRGIRGDGDWKPSVSDADP